MEKKVFTIGYSGFPDVNDFIATLKENEIRVLVDVRSMPSSAYYVNYNRENISRVLNEHGIYYRNYALEFGARQSNKEFYKDGRLDFDMFSKSEQFLSGISKVEKILEMNLYPCFMCAEKNPTDCHRAILVARAFYERGYSIVHILPNQMTKTQRDIEDELKDKLNLFETSEFDSEKNLISYAYKKQNDAIGFREENLK